MGSTVTFEQLFSGAKSFARLALDAHAEGQMEVFLLEAGVSVERLAKAALVRVHPTLLSEVKGNDDMLLHFAGATTTPPRRLHTIGASTAIARLRKMGVLPRAEELDGLIELRNGVAHLGASAAEDYFGAFVETICVLLDHLREDRTSFWGTWHKTVQVALDDHYDRTQRALQLRIDQARFRIAARFGTLPVRVVEIIAKTFSETGLVIVENSPSTTRFRTLGRCPACSNEAAALMLRATPETTLLYEMELTAEGLLCRLCGLHLTTEEEVRMAGLPSTVLCKVEDLTEAIQGSPVSPDDPVVLLNSSGLELEWFKDSF